MFVVFPCFSFAFVVMSDFVWSRLWTQPLFRDANAAFGAAAAVAVTFGAARCGRNAGADGAIGGTGAKESKKICFGHGK